MNSAYNLVCGQIAYACLLKIRYGKTPRIKSFVSNRSLLSRKELFMQSKCTHSKSCSPSLPYPCPIIKEKDPSLARSLTALYAGKRGELTSVCQYSYQHIILSSSPIVADTIECIAMTEMRHFELLGKMIYSLGADPYICEVRRHGRDFWTSSYVEYVRRPDRLIRLDMESEKKAAEAYESFLHTCSSSAVCEVIERIMLDERHHFDVLRSLLE